MSEEFIVAQAAPTLAGMKTGSLFGCLYRDKAALYADVRGWNRRLVPLGLCLLPLRFSGKRALLYLYRPDALREDLNDGSARAILEKAGYRSESSARCITELMRRLRQGDAFPHEIGLFLGYPAEDVRGFIRLGARRAKCVGAWRVYGDPEAAQRQFVRLKKCTRVYCAAYQRHRSLDRLIVTRPSA